MVPKPSLTDGSALAASIAATVGSSSTDAAASPVSTWVKNAPSGNSACMRCGAPSSIARSSQATCAATRSGPLTGCTNAYVTCAAEARLTTTTSAARARNHLTR